MGANKERYDSLCEQSKSNLYQNRIEDLFMEIDGWRRYQNAAIPNTAPHELVNIAPIEDKSIWTTSKMGF